MQEQYDLSDGSALRLTVARYFTPSGRCIQKPYKNRNRENYDEDLEDRFKHGEFLSADSIHQTDTTKFRTDKGRIVYGGGGIMPDVFVPLDTAGNNPYFQHAQQYLSEFAYDYETKHKPAFAAYTDLPKFAASFRTDEATIAAFTAFATAHGVKSPARQVGEAKNLVAKYLKAYFARQLFQDKGYYYILNYDDAAVKRAVATLGGK